MRPVTRYDLNQIGDYLYEVPESFRPDMRVPAHFYADDELLEKALEDRSLEQLVNTATLPGVVGPAMAMPDIHQGYGFPIGGVAATRLPSGVISPGGVGYDINCGIRLLATHLDADELRPHMDRLADALYRQVPGGVGVKGGLHLNKTELDAILADGSRWALREGYARKEDVDHTEEGGRMTGADPARVSSAAKKRGLEQVGTLGSGNHFAEIDAVTEILYPEAADAFGLRRGQAVVQIHCGSRGLGHQVCDDALKIMRRAMGHYGIDVPDRQLCGVPVSSEEGQRYMGAMRAAANFAMTNRHVIADAVRRVFKAFFPREPLYTVWDVSHNLAHLETHRWDGRKRTLCVHRKGATRAFAGLPVLIPGSMGTASYVLVGTPQAEESSFASTCHGAGRTMSRTEALKRTGGKDLLRSLAKRGVSVMAENLHTLGEEAPEAYKDVSHVVDVVQGAGLSLKVARLRPVAVIKG